MMSSSSSSSLGFSLPRSSATGEVDVVAAGPFTAEPGELDDRMQIVEL